MSAGDIARRLSFGGPKLESNSTVEFPWTKYTSKLEDWESKQLYLKQLLSVPISQETDQDLTKTKEYFSKLKFNYIEMQTKQRFLENIAKPREEIVPSKEKITRLETDIDDVKKRITDLNAITANLTGQLQTILEELSESTTSFEQERNWFISELEEIKTMEDEQEKERIEAEAIPEQFLENKETLSIFLRTICDMSGITIEDVGVSSLTVCIKQGKNSHRADQYRVVISFLPNLKITTIKITPNDCYVDDIIEETHRINDFGFLIRELQDRLYNGQ